MDRTKTSTTLETHKVTVIDTDNRTYQQGLLNGLITAVASMLALVFATISFLSGPGTPFELTFSYQGNLLTKAATVMFIVGAYLNYKFLSKKP